MDKPDYEEEAGIAATKSVDDVAHSRSYYEAAGLLLVWSALVLNEGSIRFVRFNSSEDPDVTSSENADGMDRIPPIVLSVTAAFECLFGIMGVILGAWALIGRGGNVKTSAVHAAVTTLLGWPVFLVFVWTVPAFAAARFGAAAEGVPPGLSESQAKFFLLMGLLGSFSFCLALQGGQFNMILRLLHYQSGGKMLNKVVHNNKMRVFFWNGNMILGGFSTLAVGALLSSQVSGSRILPPFQSPPHVGTYPWLSIITGIVMLLHGFLGVAVAFSKGLIKPLLFYTPFVYIMMYLNFVIWQLGSIPSEVPAFAAGMHSGLVIVTVLIGPYFAYKYSRE